MKNIIKIIKAHGGLEALKRDAIRIDPPSPGFMRLCIEHVGPGPRGQALLSIAHYYEHNGDLVADPEVTVEVPDGEGWDDPMTWGPVDIAMPGIGYHQAAVVVEGGRAIVRLATLRDLKSFLVTWDHNLKFQGYVEAFKSRKAAL